MDIFQELQGVEKRYRDIERRLSDPGILQDRALYQKYAREHSELNKVVSVFQAFKRVVRELEDSRELLHDEDADIKQMARDEVDRLREEKERYEIKLMALLMPKDANDAKNVIIEIRAGTGGEEAGLFAGDLFRMYSRYAENKGWKVEIISHNTTGVGGLKEVVAMIHGHGAYS